MNNVSNTMITEMLSEFHLSVLLEIPLYKCGLSVIYDVSDALTRNIRK